MTPQKATGQMRIFVNFRDLFSIDVSHLSFNHRVHILVEMKQGWCIYPLSWSIHCNFTGDGKCNESGLAFTPHPHQPRLILSS